MNKKVSGIAKLLPKDLDESVLNEIADLVSGIIQEQVEARVKVLEAKVHGFLRSRVDAIKEHAMTELTYESKEYRDAKMFNEMKTLFALDLDDEDQPKVVQKVTEELEDVREESEVLAEELKTTLTENEKLKTSITALTGKVRLLVNSLTTAKDRITNLKEDTAKPFKSSEKAVVVSNVKDEINKEKVRQVDPDVAELLGEGVMRLMPTYNSNGKE